jgi:hypothetical protein
MFLGYTVSKLANALRVALGCIGYGCGLRVLVSWISWIGVEGGLTRMMSMVMRKTMKKIDRWKISIRCVEVV